MAEPLFLDILPRPVGIQSAAASVVTSMKAAGTRAGSAFSDAFGAEAKSAGGVMAGVTRDVQRSTTELERASARVQKAKSSELDWIGRVRVATAQLTEAQEKYATGSSRVVAAEERLEKVQRSRSNASESVIRTTKQQENANKQLIASQEAAERQTSSLNTATSKLGGVAGGVASQMKGLGIGLAAGFGLTSLTAGFTDSIKTGADLERTLATLQVTTRATDEQMTQASETVRQLANDAALPATSGLKSAEVMLELSKGGLAVADSMTAARGTLQLAAAAQIDAARAAEIQANSLNMFQLPASEASKVADVLANTANQASLEIVDLANSLKYAGPVASGLKVPIEDTAAAIGMLSNQGIKGEQGGTILRGVLASLVPQSERARNSLIALGVDAFDAEGKFKGLATLIGQIQDASKRMSSEDFSDAMTGAFGRESMNFGFAAAAEGVSGFDKLREAALVQGGAADTAAAKNAGMAGSMERLENATEDLKLSLFELLKEPVASVFEKATAAIQVTSDVLRDHQGTVKAVAGTVIGLAGAWVTIKVAQGIWSGLSTVVGGASATIRGVGAAARFAGSTVTSTASGVANVASSARDYWNWTGKARVQAVGDFVATKAAAAREAVATAASWVAGGVRSAGAWTAMRARAVASFVAVRAAAAANATAAAASSAAAATRSAAAWVAGNARAAASFVAVRAALLAQTIASRGAAVAQLALNLAMTANPIGLVIAALVGLGVALVVMWNKFDWFRNGVKAVWSFIWDNVIKPIVGFIKLELQAWGRIFSWVYDNVMKPVSDKIGAVMGGIRNAFTNTVGWIRDQWGRISDIVKTPAKFVIDIVYNRGIVPLWNGIASIFHLGKINPVELGFAGGGIVPGYAGGGVHRGPGLVPGYAPGRDIVNAKLSPGEGVLVPEAVRAIGPANVLAINKRFSGRKSANETAGLPMFEGGGIFGKAFDWAKNAVGSAVDWISDPIAKIKSLFKPWVDKALGKAGESEFGKAITSVPGRMLDAAIDKVKGWVAGAFGGGNTPFKAGAGAQQWRALAMQALAREGFNPPEQYIDAMLAQIQSESGGNPNIVQGVVDVNSGGNEAVGLLQVIPGTFATYRDPSLPNDRTNPLANMVAALRYMRARYHGDINGVWGQGHGYAGGGIVMRDVIPFAGGGVMLTEREQQQLGGAPVATSLWQSIKGRFPGAQLTSAKTDHGADGGYHPKGMAIDVDPSVATAEYLFGMRDQLAQIIFGGAGGRYNYYNIGGTRAEGQAAIPIYGSDVVFGQHSDHIHVAALGPVGSGKPIPAVDPASGAAADSATAGFTDATSGGTYGATSGGTYGATSGGMVDAKAQEQITRLEQQITSSKARQDQLQASVTEYDARATKTEADAAKAKTPQAKAALLATAQRQRAQMRKYQSDLQVQQQRVTQYQTKIDNLKAGKNADGTTKTDSTTSTSTAIEDEKTMPMTWHDFGSRAGGLAADAAVETFGLGDTLLGDPAKSPFFRIPMEIGNAFLKHPVTPSGGGGVATAPSMRRPLVPTAPGTQRGSGQGGLQATPVSNDGGGGPMVNIEKWISQGSTAEDSRRLGREMRTHQGGMRR